MTRARLEHLLTGFRQATVVVVGDFFLDEYLKLDPGLSEVSLETGLEARQVVAVRRQPGGAGNVAANLCALGAGRVQCLGLIGDDGEGFELRRALGRFGAETEGLLARADRVTPTYYKPVVRLPGGKLRELERMDQKNRTPAPEKVEAELIAQVKAVVPGARAIIAQDQVQELECGAITARMRGALAEICQTHPEVIGFVDSRVRVGEFRYMIVKPNRQEACAAIHPGSPPHEGEQAMKCAGELARRVKGPVFLTMGEEGIAVVTADTSQRVPAPKLTGELDIVGAGDSATAGAVLALCAGAQLAEAAVVANLTASITVQQIGTTGTATQDQVRRRFEEYEEAKE